jgi:anti-anti-sigma regulatory factor
MQEFVMFNSTIVGKKNKGTLTLMGNLTLENSSLIKDALLEAISRFKEILVRIEELEQIDFCCFQLFCAAHNSAVKKKKAIVLIPPVEDSAKFLKLLSYSGLVPQGSHAASTVSNGSATGPTRGFVLREVE